MRIGAFLAIEAFVVGVVALQVLVFRSFSNRKARYLPPMMWLGGGIFFVAGTLIAALVATAPK